MRKLRIGICFALLLCLNANMNGQTEPDLPPDGSGYALDEIPIHGGTIFLFAALGIGSIILLRTQKTETARPHKKNLKR